MKTGKGIKLAHGFEIVEIIPNRHDWLERKKTHGWKTLETESYRILWNDLTVEQKNQLLTYC